ncbi:peroxiredoxin-2 [Hesseltinella vesiculosa]|uniref:thioredoxin-dependent peroxiredoxin n=1 Tax=Hesseltinella vesiculosa TaxID=101127 RepID=A0A1X2GPT2_9FUNG|nr:peroxiredoxin-2 [Hesseltinella vesiculosa]
MARPVMASPSIRQATAMAWRSMSTMSVSPASVQQPAPQWTGPAVVDGEFKQISLSDYRGKYVVFFWYPMDFTFVCPTEIIAFSDRIKEFQDIDTVVIGASCDSEFSHLAWTQQSRKQGGLGDIKYPLLADKTKKIARDYGVLLEEAGVTLRGLFIIDPKGVVRQITINDLPVGRNVDEVLRLVKAFKFTDEHGEVCPSSWTPGDKTIKPSVKDSKQYFESVN